MKVGPYQIYGHLEVERESGLQNWTALTVGKNA